MRGSNEEGRTELDKAVGADENKGESDARGEADNNRIEDGTDA